MSSNCYYCGGHPDEVVDLRRRRDELEHEIERLRSALTGIAEYCSGEDQTLGAIKRLVAIRNTAEQAVRGHQQNTREG